PWLNLRAGPIHSAPSTCALLAMADTAEIAQILDRRSTLELAGVSELLLDIPKRSAVAGRIEKGTLEGRHRPVDGTLAPAWHAGEGILGGTTKGDAIRRG